MFIPVRGLNPIRARVALGLCVLGVVVLQASYAQSDITLQERVERLERAVNSETLVELLQRVERLQQEVQELRGELEVQSHELSQLKKRQRELYVDIDRRLTKVETTKPLSSAGNEEKASDDNTDTQPTPDTSGTVTAQIDTDAQRDAYQKAFNLLKTGRYEDAAGGFKEFLANYPNGEYADNAQYWLGEAYYVTSAFKPALAEFQKLINTRPGSAKVSHALLKIGYIQDELGQKQAAVTTLEELIERFPTTTAASLAKERLLQIQ